MTVRLIATTVLHGAQAGEVHGGAYVINLDRQAVHQTVKLDSQDIEWVGAEGGRGLRGIAIDGEDIYLSSSNRLLRYDQQFRLTESWQNPYLVNCHGICIYQRKLFLVSTGNDCILTFDLDEKKFDWGMQVITENFQFQGKAFDPMGSDGPMFINTLQLSRVQCGDDGMYISGLNTGGLLHFNGEKIYMSVELPKGAQDARFFRNGVVFNDSRSGVLRYTGSKEDIEDRAMPLPFFLDSDHAHRDSDQQRMLKRGYARGLCVLSDTVVAGGCTPAGLSLFDLKNNKRLMTVTFTKDVNMAINCIEAWP
jgi:hypothetical protein